jgi:hypothetical protein
MRGEEKVYEAGVQESGVAGATEWEPKKGPIFNHRLHRSLKIGLDRTPQ